MLIKNTTDIGRYVAVDWSGVQGQLPRAVRNELRRLEQTAFHQLLGPGLLQWVQQARDTDPDVDADESLPVQLLGLVQAPLARLGLANSLDELQVTVGESGVQIISSATNKTAFQWQVKNLQSTLLTRADLDLDALIEWLEENYQAAPELEAWATSPAGQRHRQGLFTTTGELQQVVNISNSRAVFVALQPLLRRTTDQLLRPVLGPALLDELLLQVRTRALTSDNENLVHAYVWPALAHLALAEAIPQLGLRLNGDGVELTVARFDDSNAKESDASLDVLLQQKAQDARYYGERYLRQLREFLNGAAGAERFAAYYTSSAYTPPALPVARDQSTNRVFRFR